MADDRVNKNKMVLFAYQILDESGKIVEQSDIPMQYVHGGVNDMFPKVEQALNSKKVGDTVEVRLSPKEGFGEHDPGLTFTDDIENVPEQFRWVGAKPTFENEKGDVVEFEVRKIENGKLTIDANHPFAGQTMIFRITVLDIRDATEEELKDGGDTQPPATYH